MEEWNYIGTKQPSLSTTHKQDGSKGKFQPPENCLNLGSSLGASPSINSTSISLGSSDIFSKTTRKRSGIIELATNDNNLSEAENLTNLLASTSVNVAGNIDNQTVKKDIEFTNSDFNATMSLPIDLLTESGRDRVKNAFENLDNNLLTVGNHLTDTVSNAYEAVTNSTGNKSVIDTFVDKQKTQTRNIARSRDNRARDTLNNADRGQSAENLQYALNTGSEEGEEIKVYSNENDGSAGMYDQKDQQAYVNIANVGTNETNLIFTDGHERAHANGGNEDYANMIAQDSLSDWNKYSEINSGYQQTGYNASDYGIRTADNSSYKPTQEQYNQVYNANTNSLLRENTNSANLVAVSNRDNLPYNELLKDSKDSSPYGRRKHPITKKYIGHGGSDTYTYNKDKSFHAAGDGKVIDVRNQTAIKKDIDGKDVVTGWGNMIRIEHTDENGNPTYRTRYAHSEELPNFKKGDTVKEGQALGIMGESGGAKGKHLHYEVDKYNPEKKQWEPIDPRTVNVGKYNKLSDVPKNNE